MGSGRVWWAWFADDFSCRLGSGCIRACSGWVQAGFRVTEGGKTLLSAWLTVGFSADLEFGLRLGGGLVFGRFPLSKKRKTSSKRLLRAHVAWKQAGFRVAGLMMGFDRPFLRQPNQFCYANSFPDHLSFQFLPDSVRFLPGQIWAKQVCRDPYENI